MTSLEHFLTSVATSCLHQDGQELRALLQCEDRELVAAFGNESTLKYQCSKLLSNNYIDIVFHHCRCKYLCSTHKFESAFDEQQKACTSFLSEMTRSHDVKSNWWLRPIDSVILQYRLIAYKADLDCKRTLRFSKKVPEQLQRFFRSMIVDKSDLHKSRLMGALFVIVHLLKVYFKINNLRLCNNLVQGVESAQFPSLDHFPKSQTVAYNFYLGRRKLVEQKYPEAEKALTFSFAHCHRSASANKRRVLEFLIPVRVYQGHTPKRQLLQKHNLDSIFGPLVDAVRVGDLRTFSVELTKQQTFFIRKGIFLIVEKLRSFVYRNLFRRVLRVHQSRAALKQQNQLSFDTLMVAMRIHDASVSLDELECIVANLIFDGFMKGYIAHKRCVVVSPKMPFPPITDVAKLMTQQ